jgi:hypothetical protein
MNTRCWTCRPAPRSRGRSSTAGNWGAALGDFRIRIQFRRCPVELSVSPRLACRGLGFKRGPGGRPGGGSLRHGDGAARRAGRRLPQPDPVERGGNAEGRYGYYEAIDYTPSRVPPGQTRVLVRSFMTHHQGMILLSLAYRLLDQPMQRRFLANPSFKATELLLQERVAPGGLRVLSP